MLIITPGCDRDSAGARSAAKNPLAASEAAARDGKPEEAERMLQEALASNRDVPNDRHAIALQTIATEYNNQERIADSIRLLKKSVELMPESPELWTDLGINHRLNGEMDTAEACYVKALTFNPNYAEAHSSVGVIYLLTDRTDQAIASMEKAIKLDPSIATAHANLALAYATDGRFDEAEASLQRAVVRGYTNAPLLSERIENLRSLEPPPPATQER